MGLHLPGSGDISASRSGVGKRHRSGLRRVSIVVAGVHGRSRVGGGSSGGGNTGNHDSAVDETDSVLLLNHAVEAIHVRDLAGSAKLVDGGVLGLRHAVKLMVELLNDILVCDGAGQ